MESSSDQLMSWSATRTPRSREPSGAAAVVARVAARTVCARSRSCGTICAAIEVTSVTVGSARAPSWSSRSWVSTQEASSNHSTTATRSDPAQAP